MIDSWLAIGSYISNDIQRKRSGLSNIESGIPKDHHIQVWLKIDYPFQRRRYMFKKE